LFLRDIAEDETMKWHEVAADWPGFQQAILTRWPEADAVEVAAIDGDRAAFNAYLGRIEGLSPREAEEAIEEWLAGPMPADAQMDAVRDNANIRASRAHIPEGEDVYAEDGSFGDDDVPEPPVGRT
jgi:hypothetical protein